MPVIVEIPVAMFSFGSILKNAVFVSITGEYAVHVIDEKSGNSLPGEMEERVARLMGE